MKTKASVFFLATITAGTMAANATTISFASLSQPGSGMVSEGSSVAADGFTFSSQDDLFEVWQASNGNLPSLSAADTSLFEYFADSTTTLTDGGGLFSLSSIDLAPLIAGGAGSFTVQFTGTHADSSTVTQSFTVDDSNPTALTTFDFSNFTNLVSVSFSQGTNSGFFLAQDTAYQFDNVVVSTAAVGTPEPSMFLGLALGFVALLGVSIRRGIA